MTAVSGNHLPLDACAPGSATAPAGPGSNLNNNGLPPAANRWEPSSTRESPLMPNHQPNPRLHYAEQNLIVAARTLIDTFERHLKGEHVQHELEAVWQRAHRADNDYQAALDSLNPHPELAALLDTVLAHVELVPDDVRAAARKAYIATRPDPTEPLDRDGNQVAGAKVHWATARAGVMRTDA